MVRALEPGFGDQPVTEAVVDAGPVDAGPVRRLVSSGVEAVRSDLAAGAEVVRDVVTTAPRDAQLLARTGVAVVRPVGRAIADEATAGIPDIGAVSEMGARSVARGVARLLEWRWLDFSGLAKLGKYRTRWDP